ncbi:MAG TPA: bifunctional phosphopantothenoylcysteine decarboxylase/phosphopantothenate--cysteine ligase CoaBC [Solirubrobacterales bacterium]|jgi:phosphopantothenoylcysteine decarboxylase/phosphopantothenate--cysteine ligase|nr:bifunctional phosphopantothenoylcysteine decarboxylase/phosphopantothenate--cysteine ligase CoaBC [Solirubrobacterales bacterium]
MARILLGVSGGIAAYKALELARLATTAGHGVRVLMTEGATRFVGAASFEGIVGAPVLLSEFERDPMRGAFPGDPAPSHDPIGHLELATNCDAYLVAPASANTIAKLATGQADSMVTTSFLACTAPRLLAPAMNDRMYSDGATQANLADLRERGVIVIDPEEGALASRGEHGKGRLPDPASLLAQIEAELPTGERPWDGLRVLVTAGGTREPIDSVRFLGNRSSGRMGIALAAAAARRGADVTLIAANVSLLEPAGVRRLNVETTEQLAKAAHAEFPGSRVLLMAAAPADFKASDVAEGKLTRDASLDLHLEPTEDIFASLAAIKEEGQTVVAFAAEAGNNVDRAREKLTRKNADLIVLNDISNPAIGFESQENAVTLIDSASDTKVSQASKDVIAEAILTRVDQLRSRQAQPKT